MKNIISLLAVAVLAITFAAGCGKPTKCSEVKTPADCNKAETFDKDKGDKGNCAWKQTGATEADGVCEVKAAS